MSECVTELPDINLTITRDGEEEDLVIGPDCTGDEGGGLFFARLLRPTFTLRYDSTGPSVWVPGSGVLLNAQPDGSDVTGIIVAYGATRGEVDTWRIALVAALLQVDYQVSITVGDLTEGPWYAWPTQPTMADPVSPRRAGLLADALTISIPVEPPGAP